MSDENAPTTKKAAAKKAAAHKPSSTGPHGTDEETTKAVDHPTPSAVVDGPAFGQLVSVTSFDPYAEPPADVTRYGFVVARDGDEVRLCWLTEGPTDPIHVDTLD